MAESANSQFYVSPIADPLASEKLNKKLLRLTKKFVAVKKAKRGVKEVVKALRKGATGQQVLYGNYVTLPIEIEEEADVKVLKSMIKEKFHLDVHQQLIKFKRDGYTIRLVEGWSLDFYEIKERSILYLEKIDSIKEERIEQTEKRIQYKYLERLGINKLLNIGEEDVESEEEKNPDQFSPKKQLKSLSLASRSIGLASEKKNSNEEAKNTPEYFLECLIKATKNDNLSEVKSIFDQSREITPSKLINSFGRGGWTPFHFSIFLGRASIFKLFLEKQADINKVTGDDWSPLQLAVHWNHLEIFKMLIKKPELDVNLLTSRGSALHLCAKQNKINYAKMLVELNAQKDIKNSDGLAPADLASNKELLDILSIEQTGAVVNNFTIPNDPPIVEKPSIPAGLMGKMYKIGASHLRCNSRFFVLNPQEGTLIRYKNREDYPLRPLEVLPLKDIQYIKKFDKSWYMRNNLHYFEIVYSSRQVLGCKHESTASLWMNSIYQAVLFSIEMEEKLKKTKDLDDMNFSSDLPLHQKDINISEVPDEAREGDRFPTTGSRMPSELLINKSEGSRKGKKQSANSIGIPKKERSRTAPRIKDRTSTPAAQNEGQKNSNKINSPEQPKRLERKTVGRAMTTNQKNGTSPNEEFGENLKKIINSPETKPQPGVKLDSPGKAQNNENSLESGEKFEYNFNTEGKVNFKSFKIIRVLGSGAFGKVYLVKKKDDGKIYAMKALKKRPLHLKKQLKYAITEANVLKKANHPFILGLHYAFQTPQYLYLVLDYCKGGDLSLLLATRVTFEEEVAKFYIAEVLLAIEQLHNMNVVYRDLKPENILIGDDGHVKLADFGLSKEGIADDALTRSFCGSPAYLSPEMLKNKGSGKAADIYGIGAVLYEMLVGNPPYYSDDIPSMYKAIEEGRLTFPKFVSEDARNLITKLLLRDPNKRIGSKGKEEIKADPFFKSIDWQKLYNKEYPPPIMDFDDEEIIVPDRCVFMDIDYDEKNFRFNRVNDFSFIRSNGNPNSQRIENDEKALDEPFIDIGN